MGKTKKIKVLISDPVAKEGIKILENELDICVNTCLSEKEILKIIPDFDALVVRSETKVTKKVIETAKNLKIIGRAGVGVDNIDLDEATKHGIIVINSPRGNTLAAAEHTIALLLSLSRNIPQADRSLRARKWERKNFMGTELSGKIIGIVGLGKIGRIVANRAQSFGMKVIAHDPFATKEQTQSLGIELVNFKTLLQESDYISLHAPKTEKTYKLFSTKEFEQMKNSARIINCARGGIVDELALYNALVSKQIAGAALDVYECEPPSPQNPLLDLDNVVLTPHLAASTSEAQIIVAVDVAKQIIDFFKNIPPANAVNLPSIKPEILLTHRPFFVLAEKIGQTHASLLDGYVQEISVNYFGSVSELETSLITRYLLVGFLRPTFQDSVNFVNAPILTQNRGIKIVEEKISKTIKFSDLITVKVTTDLDTKSISGTIFNSKEIRIVRIDDYWIDLIPEGIVMLINHADKPGMIGKVGTLLGSNNINIGGMQVGRKSVRGSKAVMALSLDDDVPETILSKIRKLEGITDVKIVRF